MFTIQLDQPSTAQYLSGLDALEKCRALGLKDSTEIQWWHGATSGAHIPKVEVDEAFARAYFDRRQTSSSASIPLDMLARGDARYCNENNSRALTFADLSPERIKELYIAARFAGCRAEVERLTRARDELRERIEALEPVETSDEDED